MPQFQFSTDVRRELGESLEPTIAADVIAGLETVVAVWKDEQLRGVRAQDARVVDRRLREHLDSLERTLKDLVSWCSIGDQGKQDDAFDELFQLLGATWAPGIPEWRKDYAARCGERGCADWMRDTAALLARVQGWMAQLPDDGKQAPGRAKNEARRLLVQNVADVLCAHGVERSKYEQGAFAACARAVVLAVEGVHVTSIRSTLKAALVSIGTN